MGFAFLPSEIFGEPDTIRFFYFSEGEILGEGALIEAVDLGGLDLSDFLLPTFPLVAKDANILFFETVADYCGLP